MTVVGSKSKSPVFTYLEDCTSRERLRFQFESHLNAEAYRKFENPVFFTKEALEGGYT